MDDFLIRVYIRLYTYEYIYYIIPVRVYDFLISYIYTFIQKIQIVLCILCNNIYNVYIT